MVPVSFESAPYFMALVATLKAELVKQRILRHPPFAHHCAALRKDD